MYYVNSHHGFLCKKDDRLYFCPDAREAIVFNSFIDADEAARSANLTRWAIFQPSHK